MSDILITWDPGIRNGWAYFVDKVLERTGVITKNRLISTKSILLPFADRPPLDKSHNYRCIIEKPTSWQRDSQKSSQTALIQNGILVGNIARAYSDLMWKIEYVTAGDWKGSVPKHIMGKRILNLLTTEEKELLPPKNKTRTNPLGYDHNMLDAIGIGVISFKRNVSDSSH